MSHSEPTPNPRERVAWQVPTTHALPFGVQGRPSQRDTALCGAVVRLQDDAGNRATCPACQSELAYLETLSPF